MCQQCVRAEERALLGVAQPWEVRSSGRMSDRFARFAAEVGFPLTGWQQRFLDRVELLSPHGAAWPILRLRRGA